MTGQPLRWRLADEDADGQGALFSGDDVLRTERGTGRLSGLEFLHVHARRIINEVPGSSRMPFRYTINAYRGCSHACSYCLAGETPILMANGRTKPLADIRAGDRVYGTVRQGNYRRYVPTEVLAHWSTTRPALRITLGDGTTLIASGDHRFLTGRGWKHVTGTEHGNTRRPHLTMNDKLIGVGHFAAPPKETAEYRRGYLCGMVRGDAHLGSYSYQRAGRTHGDVHRFRLALVDDEALRRTEDYLAADGIVTRSFVFQVGRPGRKDIRAIRTSARNAVLAIGSLISWPHLASDDWRKGFLAGTFDAEGSNSCGVLRIVNKDPSVIAWLSSSLDRFGFHYAVEQAANGCTAIRLRGGLRERLRFLHTVDPSITRKRSVEGMALKGDADLRVTGIEPLGLELPMYDITTGTGDFIADGIVSHNCFARPTHAYLGLDIGADFDSRIVVKVNAVERVRAELRSPRWAGDHIAMGTNTDPYQQAEGKYRLTRGIVAALGEAGNPFSILTKSATILRDLDVLVAASRRTTVRANLSIGTLDEAVWRSTEPGTPNPRRRVEAVRRLNDAGIPTGVLVAPVLPGLSDRPEQLAEVVTACVEAGAVSVSALALHLRPGVREHFLARLAEQRPDLAAGYAQRYRDGAYLPRAEQDALTDRVRRLVAAAGGTARTPRASRSLDLPVAPPVRPDAAPQAAAVQLPLDG